MAFIFGGRAQMIAGYQEFKCGNNFGYSAFVSYGAFWIALGIIFMLNHFNIYHASTTDVGWFLVGFILLDLAHFGFPSLTKVAGYELMLCAASALYMMAHVIYAQVFGRDVLPVGEPWIKPKA